MPPTPKDTKLYEKIKRQAKKKFDVWPSAYASAWLVREYKKQGGKYKGSKNKSQDGLTRWFDEKWIDVCELPKKKSCGRIRGSYKKYERDYPYCRPSVRYSKKTPELAQELSKKEIRRRCSRKRSSPSRKVRKK